MMSSYLLAFLFAYAYLLVDVQVFAKTIASPSYVLASSTTYNGIIPVTKYTTKTGLTIVIARTSGPIVKSYFCLATKVRDDNGEPHILEHLVFLGSEDYPYKGALDLIANKCYSDGTNGETSDDSTCYTSSHVGKDGLLTLLPIFMDHLLYPTLAPSGFITEVYHVNGDGTDGGVVYSEMEGKPYRINHRTMLRTLYGDFGYASETGGRVENFRQNTTYQMVVDYHKKFYRPDNLCITICGNITIDEVMNSIQLIEEKILTKPKLPKWERPWHATMPALVTKTAKYLTPWTTEGKADIYIAWRGPNCVTEYTELLGCTILMAHLNSIVNATDFFAKSIQYVVKKNVKSALDFHFWKVSVAHADLVYPKFHKWLEDIVTRKIKLDMEKIKESINMKLSLISGKLDSAPFEEISNNIQTIFLYGKSENDLETTLNIKNVYEFLLTVSDSYYIDLMNEYFINRPYAHTIGIESISEYERVKKENEERVSKRVKQLGPKGLKTKADELATAIKYNSRPVPDALLSSIPSPSIKNVNLYDVQVYRTGDSNNGESIGLDINSWPLYAEAYDFRTDYVYIIITIATHKIIPAYRPYIYLLLKVIDESPFGNAVKEISVIDFSAVNKAFQVGLSNALPFSCGKYSQTALYRIKAFRGDYATAAKFVIANLRHTEFSRETVKKAAEKMFVEVHKAIGKVERDCLDLLRTFYYKLNSNTKMNSKFFQRKFLKSLLTKLKDDDDESRNILYKLNRLRDVLVSRKYLALHVATDFTALSKDKTNFNAVWDGFGFTSGEKKLMVEADWQVMAPGDAIRSQGEIVALRHLETVHLCLFAPGLHDFDHEDFAPLTVALKYCSQQEGPLFKRVRGPGYTYVAVLQIVPDEGLIFFALEKATDVVRAFNESITIINELAEPDAIWHPAQVESAKNSAIYDAVSSVSDTYKIPLTTVMSSFRKVSTNFNRDLNAKIKAVTTDDLKRVAAKYLKNIFSTSKSKIAIVCNGAKATDIALGLQKFGFDLRIAETWDASALNLF